MRFDSIMLKISIQQLLTQLNGIKYKSNLQDVLQWEEPTVQNLVVNIMGFLWTKVWHSTSKYRKIILQCNKKFKDKEENCKTLPLIAKTIQMMFLNAYNTFMGNSDRVLEDCELMCKTLIDFTNLAAKIEQQNKEIKAIAELIIALIKENTSAPRSQYEFIKKSNKLSNKYEEEYKKLDNL